MDRALAARCAIGYTCAMRTRLAAVVCLVLAGFSLGGCTKCGFIWEQGPRACHTEETR